MSGFTYLDGQLHADRVPLAEVAAAVGTPAYVYAGAIMRARLASSSRPSPAGGSWSATRSRRTATSP